MPELSEQTTTYLVRHFLEEHDQGLGSLYGKITPIRPELKPSDVGQVLSNGVELGIIEHYGNDVFRWRGNNDRYPSAVQRWENWLRTLDEPHSVEGTHAMAERALSITRRMASDAIGELQAQQIPFGWQPDANGDYHRGEVTP